MLRKLTAGILALSLIVVAPYVHAAAKTDKGAQSTAQGPRRHLTTIVFAGLAGAVLGLSTLSFYGRPQDRLSNIAVGFAVGVITGTVYATYKAATEPKEFYNLRQAKPELWVLEDTNHRNDLSRVPRTGFVFEF